MNLTSTEIFKLVWDRIRDSLLGKTVPMMYADHYPNNPSGEFIVVGSLSNVVGDSQVATVNVNIYVPDTTPTIGREEQRYPDRNRLNELTRLAFDSLGYYPINERWFFDVSDETLISEEGISYTFSNLKVKIKDSTNYFQLWDDMLENKIFPTSFEWWGINISFGFMLICLIGIKIFLYRKSNKHKEGKTIQVKSYSNLSLNSAEQIISSIIPWLTIFADKLDFMVLFVCIILQCCFIAIASYNNNNYNLLCSIWGYRYYEVYTEENTYILISGKCIRNKNEIKKFIEVTDYMGLIINEK